MHHHINAINAHRAKKATNSARLQMQMRTNGRSQQQPLTLRCGCRKVASVQAAYNTMLHVRTCVCLVLLLLGVCVVVVVGVRCARDAVSTLWPDDGRP